MENQSTYPPPPNFYKRFTDELKEKLKTYTLQDGSIPEKLPLELEHWRPPEISDKFMRFGALQSTTLVDQQLDPETHQVAVLYDEKLPVKKELLRLHRLVVVDTQNLCAKLARNPKLNEEMDSLREKLLTIAFLLNKCRPAEAHAKIKSKLEKNLDFLKNKHRKTLEIREKIEEIISAKESSMDTS